MAIHSGVPAVGYYNGSTIINDLRYPDVVQGFGVMKLDE